MMRLIDNYADGPVITEPVVVKVLQPGRSSKTEHTANNHIIVSEGDGDRILSANKLGGDFLRKARVIIVVQN